MDYIIIGNGVSGSEAALWIRKHDSSGRIMIFSESAQLFYYRPKLIDILSDSTTLEKITLNSQPSLDAKNIECNLNQKIQSIDPGQSVVRADNGEEFHYDRLLLATGANCFKPPVEGSDKSGVFTLRTYEDAVKIREYCANLESVVFIGGGLLGLETASSLLKTGQRGTVIEFFPRLLPRQLDQEGADYLMNVLKKIKPIDFIVNQSVVRIKGEDAVRGVVLKSGLEIECQAVIISAGVRPRTELAEAAGIKVDRGIVVDDYLETSEKGVYCAGDASNHRGRAYGLWLPSKEQGKIAGLNMCGVQTRYEGSVVSARLKVSGIDMFSAGFSEESGFEMRSSVNPDYFLKLFRRDGRETGVIALGKKEVVDLAEKVFSNKADRTELERYL